MQIKKSCYYCDNKIDDLDYKDVEELQRFTNSYGLILPKRRTGVCSKHQRKLAMGVKRARVMALALFTNK